MIKTGLNIAIKKIIKEKDHFHIFQENELKLSINIQQIPSFYADKEEYSGVNKIASKVMHDIKLVIGNMPKKTDDLKVLNKYSIIYGTIGKSKILDILSEQKKIDLNLIKGKRESYIFNLVESPLPDVECALVIAGSDKRGTIFGLFHLSELIGVSPLVNWSDVKPARRENITLTEYRGFFINDDWPAFGNWTMKRFGGFNAKMYEHVFELLLRLKGNYLWPAMWSSCFSIDGPGLESAELADELGVVMGLSHHEPCLRHGEEYRHLRGKDSIYGDAWNFITNREGITRFWEDGLKRSGSFENVITVGMRGEQDSTIMGKDATLKDNIDLLRDVLKTQNRLISEHINDKLDRVPRMLALYKEVEPFFYGDDTTPGLMNSEELENVILMLCDDNFGNLRTLPTDEMRNHKGGYGMYYHFDYHGWPVSYEWINSSYLPKVWEQMTAAYDFGIRDLWIVNVGDICTQEFPLSYFLDLAYDFDRWGTDAINMTETYTRQWMNRQFSGFLSAQTLNTINEILNEYTRIAHMRRPEAMNADVYHPVNYSETDRMLSRIENVIKKCEALRNEIPEEISPAFYELVYYPAIGNMNLQRMQLLAGKNLFYAGQGRVEANHLAEEIGKCIERDRSLVKEFHEINGGKWFGMGLSEHIGFKNWCEEECSYPLRVKIEPANKPRTIVSIEGTGQYTQGGSWTGKTLYINDFTRPDVDQSVFEISCGSTMAVDYEISCDNKWLEFSKLKGSTTSTDIITVTIDRNKQGNETEAEIFIKSAGNNFKIIVNAAIPNNVNIESMTYIETNGYIAMEAEHYHKNIGSGNAEFRRIAGYGKTMSAMKVFPQTGYFTPGKDAPYLEYRFIVTKSGDYKAELYMAPSNPVSVEGKLCYGIQINDDEICEYNVIPQGQKVGDNNFQWAQGVVNNIRKHSCFISCVEGLNVVRIYAVTPAFVLERIIIHPADKTIPESYLGPEESYYVR